MKERTPFAGMLGPYGAAELKSGYQRFLLRALVLSSLIHLVLVGTYRAREGLFTGRSGGPVVPGPNKIPRPDVFFLPPSVKEFTDFTPVVRAGSGVLKGARSGIPVPVPEAAVEEEWNPVPASAAHGSGGEGTGTGGSGVFNPPEIEETPVEATLVEREPMMALLVKPQYPEIARAAGVEGTVVARLLITKEGKVREVVILKSDSELFDQAVIDAASQWLFTPAMMSRGPVPVWKSVSFHFMLKSTM